MWVNAAGTMYIWEMGGKWNYYFSIHYFIMVLYIFLYRQKQTVLFAHAKKLKERAKKFGQNPQSTPTKPLIKPLKRPSTENIGTEEVSPVKQIKVEPEVLLVRCLFCCMLLLIFICDTFIHSLL